MRIGACGVVEPELKPFFTHSILHILGLLTQSRRRLNKACEYSNYCIIDILRYIKHVMPSLLLTCQ